MGKFHKKRRLISATRYRPLLRHMLTQNLIYSIEDHQIRIVGKPESTRRTSFGAFEDAELAGAIC